MKITKKELTKIVNKVIKKTINESSIMWHYGINKKSDYFTAIINSIKKANLERKFGNLVNDILNDILMGKKIRNDVFDKFLKNADFYVAFYNELLRKKMIDKFVCEDIKEFIYYMLEKSNKHKELYTILLKGILDDISEGGKEVFKYAKGATKKALKDMSIKHGKEKFAYLISKSRINK